MGKFVITEQEKQHIKKLYNLITEQKTEDEMRTEFETKFPCTNWKNGTFKEEGGTIVYSYYSKGSKGNAKKYLNGTAEIIDGVNQGHKVTFECKDGKFKSTATQKSQAEIDIDNKLKNFPCLDQDSVNWWIRKTSDGKTFIGVQNTGGGYTWYNLDDSTYFCKGGSLDGEKGKFSCNGNELVWGDLAQSGTSKKVTKRNTPIAFLDVTKESPIIYGMRDGDDEGLIYQIQQKLKELNLYTGNLDGQFGPATLKAVKEFQTNNKDKDGNQLASDGKIGPKTIESLGLYKY